MKRKKKKKPYNVYMGILLVVQLAKTLCSNTGAWVPTLVRELSHMPQLEKKSCMLQLKNLHAAVKKTQCSQ